jgi:hypothetical protein
MEIVPLPVDVSDHKKEKLLIILGKVYMNYVIAVNKVNELEKELENFRKN